MEGEEEEGEGVGVVVVGVGAAEDPPLLQEDGGPPEGLTADQQPPIIAADYSPPLEKVTETIFTSTEILKSVGSEATDHLPV